MLIVSRKKSESILIGDDIEILVTEIGTDRVKIGITAPKGVQILRKELLEARDLNREASVSFGRDALDDLKNALKNTSLK
jgi:carbon storage regulator